MIPLLIYTWPKGLEERFLTILEPFLIINVSIKFSSLPPSLLSVAINRDMLYHSSMLNLLLEVLFVHNKNTKEISTKLREVKGHNRVR